MKINAISSLTPATSKLAFGLACALIAGAGWGAKIGFDQIAAIHDEIAADMEDPSPESVRAEWRKSALPPSEAPTQAAPPIQLFLTNPAAPVFQ